MKLLNPAPLALLATLSASPALANSPDLQFLQNAAEGGLSEVELGQLAERKAVSVDVKEFAALMVKVHSAANEKLKALACTKAIILPGTPGVMRTSNRTKLKLLSGNKFDKSYIKGMIVDHKDDIKELQKEADQLSAARAACG